MSPVDRELEQSEALIAAYRDLPQVEPAPELDRAILAAARAALVRDQPQRARWPALLATAATFTLAIGLAWQLRDNDLRTEAPVDIGPTPASAPMSADTGGYAADAPKAEANAPAVSASGQIETQTGGIAQDEIPKETESLRAAAEKAEDAPSRERDQTEEPALSAPAAVVARKPAPPPPMDDGVKSDTYRSEEKRQAGFAQPDAASAPEVAAPVRDAAPQAAPEPAPVPFPLEEPLPAAGAPPPPAPPPPASPATAVPKPAGPAMPAKAATEAESGGLRLKRSVADFDSSDPAAWLEDIRRLLRQGHRERARDQLEAFRQAFPEAEIPEDLRDLAR